MLTDFNAIFTVRFKRTAHVTVWISPTSSD